MFLVLTESLEMLKKILDCADGNGQTVVFSSFDLSKAEGKDTFLFSTYGNQSIEYFKAVSAFVIKNTPFAVRYVFHLYSLTLTSNVTSFRLNINAYDTPLTEKFISDLETHFIKDFPFKETFFIL